uniref:Uncharacterized protein n=1 Tax=Brassica oleracea var. oleracea TaxID=109376 RepID=A0A0D3B8A6_BRAOL
MIVEDERDGYPQLDVSVFAQPESNRSSQVYFTYSTDMPSNLGNMMSIRNRVLMDGGALRSEQQGLTGGVPNSILRRSLRALAQTPSLRVFLGQLPEEDIWSWGGLGFRFGNRTAATATSSS